MKIFKFFVIFTFLILTAEANNQKEFASVLNSVQKIEKRDGNTETNILNSRSYFEKHRNLINSSKDIIYLKKILEAYKKGSNKVESTVDNKKSDELYVNDFNYQTFIIYLRSIMFLSKNTWSVWINNIKITNNNNSKDNEFYIRDIDNRRIVLQWNISEFKWNYVNKMNSIPKQKYKVLDDGSVELVLILYSNQSYLPFADQIVEGRYTKKIETKSDTNEDSNTKDNKEEENDPDFDLDKIINSL